MNDCLEHSGLGPTQLVRGLKQLKMLRIKREGAGRVVGLQRPLKVAHIGLGWRGKGVCFLLGYLVSGVSRQRATHSVRLKWV